MAYKSSPFLPRKTGKRAYFRVSNRQRGGLVPGLEAFRSSPFLPRETVFSPLFPHKRKIGNQWKKCYNVPNLSVECLKTWNCEAQSECPNTALGSTINETFGTADFRSTYSYYANSLKKRQTTNGCHFSFLKTVPSHNSLKSSF